MVGKTGYEIRELGDKKHIVVYTEDQDIRRRLKQLPGYQFETLYFNGLNGQLAAVDCYFVGQSVQALKQALG
jgi:hypothetical protein